ncbi:MAG: DUF3500 domain-containing protein [Nocardioides sp.]
MEIIPRDLEVDVLGLVVGDIRHQDNCFFSVFGRPGFDETWGWRFLGHHVSLCSTVIPERYVVPTPLKVGSQPARAGVLSRPPPRSSSPSACCRRWTRTRRRLRRRAAGLRRPTDVSRRCGRDAGFHRSRHAPVPPPPERPGGSAVPHGSASRHPCLGASPSAARPAR